MYKLSIFRRQAAQAYRLRGAGLFFLLFTGEFFDRDT
nr:MAG TPA: hypothetical protein [Caudoviricetes sp.]